MKANFNIDNIVRPSIKALKPYSSARDEFKNVELEMVFLDANENPYNNGLNRYPDPQQTTLKNHLAAWKGVSYHNILLGNGSDEVLDLLFRAFCEPKQDHVILLPPTYGMYKVLADLNGIDTVEIPLTMDFQPVEKEIIKVVNESTKLICICSPNNPSGNSIDPEKIEFILNNFGGLVVIDEAYIDFSTDDSWLSRLEDFPNLIITQTMSKAFALAGIRLGICYASKEIISILNKIKPPYNVNSLTQNKALEQLMDIKTIKKQSDLIIKERALLAEKLRNVGFVNKVFDSDANFILIKVDDANKRYDQLIKQGIVVRNRTNLPLCSNCLRITIGTETENELLIDAMLRI